MSIGAWQLLFIILFFVLPYIIIIYGSWVGVRRTGYNGIWSLILLIPVLNIIMLFVFAFATWPIERRAGDTSE